MNELNAADNPAMATQVIDKVMSMTEETVAPDEVIELKSPQDLSFDLPGGYLTFNGELIKEAEVRELTGRDEEALSRLKSTDKILQEVLMRGTVRIGNEKPTEEILDMVLSGDRDYLLMRIFAATFGEELQARPWCSSCQSVYEQEINLLTDVEVKTLDGIAGRRIKVETSKGTVIVDLPTGAVQRKMTAALDKSVAEISSVMLSETVVEINDMPVLSKSQILDMPIRDRRTISEAVIKNLPGPQLQDLTVTCNCGKELEVPLSLAALFQFS